MTDKPEWRRSLRLHQDVEGEIDSELEFHIQTRADELAREGMTVAAARSRAEEEFGDRIAARESCRAIDAAERGRAGRADWRESLRLDLLHAFRRLRKAPGYAALAMITLALGIGATLAIFGVVNGVLLRPFPYAEPERLLRVFETYPTAAGGTGAGSVSYPNFRDWRAQSQTLTELALVLSAGGDLSDTGDPVRISIARSSGNLFTLLGVQPMLGRGLLADDDRPDTPVSMVLSETFWRNHYGADRAVVGRTVRLNERPVTIVGVMPATVQYPAEASGGVNAWVSYKVDSAAAASRGWHSFEVLGRMKPGITQAQVEQEMAGIATHIATEVTGADKGRSATVRPLRDTVVGNIKPTLVLLFGASAMLLLIACANAGSLVLARAMSRRREIAVLAALGAGRGRIVQQFVLESVLLALGAAILGGAIGVAGIKAIASSAGTLIPRATTVTFDYRGALFLAGVVLLTTLLFGVTPALQATGSQLHRALRTSDRNASGVTRFRSVLVVVQIALSLVLLIGAGLLVRTTAALIASKTGMSTESLLTAHLPVPPTRYPDAETANSRLFAPMLEQVRSIPGVKGAGFISHLPLQQFGTNGNFKIRGRTYATPNDEPFAEWRTASPGYFAAAGVRIARGRDFLDTDGPGGVQVIVINEALAKAYFPGEDPIGKQVDLELPSGQPNVIIGVVGNVRQSSLAREPVPEFYLPIRQSGGFGTGNMTLMMQTDGDPSALASGLRRVVRSVEPMQIVDRIMPMNAVVRSSITTRLLYMRLLAAFALVALILTVAGLYGVMSYGVAQRSREFGIRIALGASSGNVRSLVVWQGLRLVGAGIVLGAGAAFLLTRLLATLIYGVTATDPTTFAGTIGLLGLVALAASYVPARRATRVSPMQALTSD